MPGARFKRRVGWHNFRQTDLPGPIYSGPRRVRDEGSLGKPEQTLHRAGLVSEAAAAAAQSKYGNLDLLQIHSLPYISLSRLT